METFNKEKIKDFENSDLTIYWWNFGRKTLDFKGVVKDYLKRENIKYKISTKKDEHFNFEQLYFKVSMSVGSMNFSFNGYDLEDLIRMCINIRLTYLGDKSKFILNGRERTINF